MNEVLLSVIICTRNRADELAGCLPAAARQAKSFADAEIIVVDNGSTDNTKQLVEEISAQTEFPVRYVFEPIAGLCQARNRGRREARGKIISYIDDDVVLKDDWIKQIREHFLAAKSDCLAGKVTTELEGELPFSPDDAMAWFFCATTLGDEPKFIRFPDHPIGCNMSFKTEVFDTVGGFDTNLKLYGDETDFFRRVAETDFSVYYNPSVEVSQFIPSERLTVKELRHKSYIWGTGSATLWLISSPGLIGRAVKFFEYFLRTLYVGATSLSGGSFGKFYTFWYNWGYAVKLLKGL